MITCPPKRRHTEAGGRVPALGLCPQGSAGGPLRGPRGDDRGGRRVLLPPGHAPEAEKGTAIVQFSPTEELAPRWRLSRRACNPRIEPRGRGAPVTAGSPQASIPEHRRRRRAATRPLSSARGGRSRGQTKLGKQAGLRGPGCANGVRCPRSVQPLLAKLESTCHTFHYGKLYGTSHSQRGRGFSSAERR